MTDSRRKSILDYFIKTLNGMALGLFSTLIISVIVRQIGTLLGIDQLGNLADTLASFMGIGIGLGVAWSLNLQRLHLIAGAVAGGIAASIAFDPLLTYITTIVAIEGLRLILRKQTPMDIILIPFISALIAFTLASLIGPYVVQITQAVGMFIETATTLRPFIMGIIIAVVMGMALTSPISSAAIAFSIGLTGIAGGAAVVGGAAQMIGFAVMSRKDNNFGTVLSVAIGTSMLQFKNIIKKPIIWLPTIIISAILGPLATVLFKMESAVAGSGMGTSGFVGQIGTFEAMGYTAPAFIGVALLHIIIPIFGVLGLDLLFRKKGWIVEGDLSLKE